MEDGVTEETEFSFDSKALDGLRGFAAVHLVLHHATMAVDKHRFNIYGQVYICNKIYSHHF